MSIPVVTAVTGATVEATLVATLERSPVGVTVVRRCVDLADLLAVAASGTARAALLSADLRRLDRDAIARLAAARVAVVGLAAPGDDEARARLRQLGLRQVVAADAPAETIAAAVVAALAAGEGDPVDTPDRAFGDPLQALPDLDVPGAAGQPTGAPEPGTGRLVAVWGPTGAPGRTTLAVGVATELAAAGTATLLADADVYGGVIAQVLGLLDEAPGLAAAARLANTGALDLWALAKVAPTVAPHLRVLTGISRADRWPELRAAALDTVWALARSLAEVTVVDCGFSLERDEELSFDTAAPRRNGATLVTLEAADVVLAVGAGDPVGVQRLVRGLADLREAVPAAVPRVVVNQVRSGAVGGAPESLLGEALARYAGVRGVAFVPYDRRVLDATLLTGRSLAEVAPSSPVRRAIAAIAADLAARPVPAAAAVQRQRRGFWSRRPPRR